MISETVPASPYALTAPEVRRGSRWTEFCVTGGATLALFPLAWALRRFCGLNASEYGVGFVTFYGAYLVNDPHFSVTYLLFYKDLKRRALDRELPLSFRTRYWIAGFVVPLILATWAGIALHARSAQSLGWMVQLMYLLVGWHYAKQGFGALAVLSARRGVRIAENERKALLFHCYAGWAFAWANPAAPAAEFEEKGLVYWALAHPRWLEVATGTVLATSSLVLVAALMARWKREHRTLPLAPLCGFLITIWSWTIFSSYDRLIQYAIPALHSIQYGYFVWLMKRNEARATEGPPTFGRPVSVRVGALALSALGLGWALFHGAPDLLDHPASSHGAERAALDGMGPTPFLAAIFVMVNIHHYFMDHVIWRRENPDTRFLRQD